MNKKEFGKKGEELAASLLKGKGYEIVCMNFSCKAGEIDIIAKKERTLVFCEVKTRESDAYGNGREAVTGIKIRHMKRAAECFLRMTEPDAEFYEFQVVEIQVSHIDGNELWEDMI